MLAAETGYYENESMFHGFVPCIMGTRFDLLIVGLNKVGAEALWGKVAGELERLDRMLNRFDPGSEVSRINSGPADSPVAITSEMKSVLKLCRLYYEMTEGLFDITLTDFSKVTFPTFRTVSFGELSLSIDLGGFAKGYAVKKISDMLRQSGVGTAFVDFGRSSVMGLGCHPCGDCWKVSLPDPNSGVTLGEFDLRDSSLSTSGNTVGYTAHIRNPFTGVYDAEMKFATVLSDDPLDGEVLSTVRMIADDRQWERIAANFRDVQGVIYTM